MDGQSFPKKVAFTLKGVFTDRLYTRKCYESAIRTWLCKYPNIKVEGCSYELDSKRRLHCHGTIVHTGKLPLLKPCLGKGWHVYTRSVYDDRWIHYCKKDSRYEHGVELDQELAAWRGATCHFDSDVEDDEANGTQTLAAGRCTPQPGIEPLGAA